MNNQFNSARGWLDAKQGATNTSNNKRKSMIFPILILLLLFSASILGVIFATSEASTQPSISGNVAATTKAKSATSLDPPTLRGTTGLNPIATQKTEKLGQGACPPTTAINGTVGSGSPDFPATNGQQTGRLVNGLGNNTCGSSNPCSLNTPTGSRAFDAYTFNNPGATACVTVNFTLAACAMNSTLQFSARLGSFDPANPCTNYVGDGGAGFGGPNSGSFSFNVPAGQDFVVVVNENDPATATGCAYTLTISGISCPSTCPPTTAITGTIGKGSTDFPGTSGVQTGRTSNDGVVSSCAAPKTCPGILSPGVPFAFDSYQFVNDSGIAACVTFTFPTACGANQAIKPVAYLGSFDPANPCTNYLGDPGQNVNSSDSRVFSVTVPANSIVVLVVHEVGTQPGCAGYSFTVTGMPCQSPCAITCPANITQSNDVNQCGAVVNFSAPTTGGDCGVVTCTPASGAFFPVGTTTVTCTTQAGPSCSFTVTVNDAQPPTITCPANLTQSTDANLCSAVVSYSPPTASDNCPGVTTVCSPASGSTFQTGTTTVTCTATDAANNTATCSFTVTVNDTQAPTLTCPVNLTVLTPQNVCSPSACAVVNFATPVATDNCPGVTVVCNPASGACFPVGTTTVTCTATDASGNSAACSFSVSVFDVCLQDDSNPAATLLFNSLTGDYRFCCNGTVFTGKGKIGKLGCNITLQHNAVDRRVSATIDKNLFRGSASIQSPVGTNRCSITDRDVRNNACLCQ